jgi:enolase
MIVKEASAKEVKDSRGEKTICVTIKTSVGSFSASSPSGKSTGKYEVKPYKKNLEGDIKNIGQFSDYFSEDILENFSDLKRVEDILEGHVGANTLFAFESAVLKAIAKEQKKEVWQLINAGAKKSPRLVGNCIGGGMHSSGNKNPDFQEFLLIPNLKSVKENWEKNKKDKKEIKIIMGETHKKFSGKKNDEDAWMTEMNEREVFDVLLKLKVPLGVDVAASSFFKRQKYLYNNPMLKRDKEEQLGYLSNLIKNFRLFYIEDPFNEEDFESFAKLLKKCNNCLVVGDDLTVTNSKRLTKAIKAKSINAIIVKPNQCGSLIEVRSVCELAKENGIKIVFSHRSGETDETILADLAFGFGADFFKCGITGSEREVKIKRLIEIEQGLR